MQLSVPTRFAVSLLVLSLQAAYAAEPALPSDADMPPQPASVVEVRGAAMSADTAALSQSSLGGRSAGSPENIPGRR